MSIVTQVFSRSSFSKIFLNTLKPHSTLQSGADVWMWLRALYNLLWTKVNKSRPCSWMLQTIFSDNRTFFTNCHKNRATDLEWVFVAMGIITTDLENTSTCSLAVFVHFQVTISHTKLWMTLKQVRMQFHQVRFHHWAVACNVSLIALALKWKNKKSEVTV